MPCQGIGVAVSFLLDKLRFVVDDDDDNNSSIITLSITSVTSFMS